MARYGFVEQEGLTLGSGFDRSILTVEFSPKNPTGAAVTAQVDVFSNNLLETTLKGADKFFGLGGPSYDYPNPRGPRQPQDIYVFTHSSPIFLPFVVSTPALAFSSDKATVTCTASDSPSGQDWSGSGYMARYELDTSIQLRGVFLNPLAGVAIDPTIVTLFVMDPNGNTTIYSSFGGQVIRDSTGRYHLVIEPSLPGTWTYKFQGTGVATATSPDTTFEVSASVFIA